MATAYGHPRPEVYPPRIRQLMHAAPFDVALSTKESRDQEGLPVAEIARRLGRARAPVKAYLYDPA